MTLDGKVFVYDMHFDKYYPLCVQSVVSKRLARLNHVSFNPSHPLLIVGDSRGEIVSPNSGARARRSRCRIVQGSEEGGHYGGQEACGPPGLAQVRDIPGQQQDIEQ